MYLITHEEGTLGRELHIYQNSQAVKKGVALQKGQGEKKDTNMNQFYASFCNCKPQSRLLFYLSFISFTMESLKTASYLCESYVIMKLNSQDTC